ncbi:MAG: hypothetical protein KF740_19985 [Ramlibacter sp.]|nr:hypothetical protein [Ramlibacter sp.]
MPRFRFNLITAWASLPPHLALVVLALFLVLGACLHVGASYQLVRAAHLAAGLEEAKARTSRQARQPIPAPDQAQELRKKLVSRLRADDVVRDAGRFALATNISISTISMTPAVPTTTEWGHVGITVQATCSYSACKAFIAELLGRYPSLAIKSLGLKPTAAGSALQELRLVLALYVAD